MGRDQIDKELKTFRNFSSFKGATLIASSLALFSFFLISGPCQDIRERNLSLQTAMKKLEVARTHTGYKFDQIEKCLFPYISVITDGWRDLPPLLRRNFSTMFQRPDNPDSWWYKEGLPYILNTPHFKFHYTKKGPDAVPLKDVSPQNGVPDFVDVCAEAFEKSFVTVTSQLGFKAPLDDMWMKENGGDHRYDVYLFSGPWLGFTMPESAVAVQSTSAVTSLYFGINSRAYEFFGESEGRRYIETTCAHEFFHGVQFAYNYFSVRWFMEATCTLMERIVYDGSDQGETDGNKYYSSLLNYWFRYPDWSLTRFDGWHEYGSVIWAIFLTERFDLDIIKDIFEDMSEGTYRELVNFSDPLASRGANLGSAFKEFTVWNYFTSHRHDKRFYSRGYEYPPIQVHLDNVHEQYPVKVFMDSEKAPESLSARYIRFIPAKGQTSISIKIDGSNIDDQDDLQRLGLYGTRGWGAKLIMFQKDRSPRIEEIFPFRRSQEGQINFSTFGSDVEEIVLVLSNLHPDLDIYSITYSAGQPPKGKLSEPKLDKNDNGEITLTWELLDITGVKEVAIVRKRFDPSQGDIDDGEIRVSEVYSATDLDMDGIPDGNIDIISKVPATTTTFTDNTTFNDVDVNAFGFDPQAVKYYYAIVPVSEYGIFGAPAIARVGITPTFNMAPVMAITTRKMAPGEWLITLKSTQPLLEPPSLISISPDGRERNVKLSRSFGGVLWEGTLIVDGFPPEGIYTFEVSAKNYAGMVGTTIVEGKQFYYSGEDGDDVLCYPNPFHLLAGGYVKFRPAGFKISIYDCTGRIVNILPDDSSEWDGRNSSGNIVSPGIYIYTAERDKIKKVGKIAILR